MAHPGSVVVSAAQIATRVDELAAEVALNAAPAPQRLVLICVLTGALLLTADLARSLNRRGVEVEIDTVAVRSYVGTTQSGRVEMVKDVGRSLRDRDVLIVEDIVDTGLTTAFVIDRIAGHAPTRLRLLTLLDKPAHRCRDVSIDHRGFLIADDFVVGYGLDLDERWRELPDVRLLDTGTR